MTISIKNKNELIDLIKYIDSLKIKSNNKSNNKSNKLENIKNNNFLMKLNKDITECYFSTLLKNNEIVFNCDPHKTTKSYIKDLQFISDNTIDYIVNKLKYSTKYVYKNNIIQYMTTNKIDKIPIVIKQMFSIICLMKKLFHRESYSQNITYYECDFKKQFPLKKSDIIGTEHINSGLTKVNITKNGDIILYRKEEVLKVLIHELIHSNLADWNLIISRHWKNSTFNKLFCTNYLIQINEGFTESMATMIHLFYKNIINKGGERNLDILFKRELKYSNYICSKIFKHYNLDSINDVMSDIKSGKCKNIFLQDSNVFSYYILKNILLTHHIEFGECLENGLIQYKIKDTNIISNIIDIIVNNIKYFDNNVLIPYKNTIPTNSMRMCL